MPINRVTVAALSFSAAALVGLVAHEGYTPVVVLPLPGDKLTIGFGTTDGVKPGDTTTPVKALQRALRDVSAFEGNLKKCVKVPLSQSEYDAYVGFSYNVGAANFCKSTLVKKLNAQDYSGACAELLRWTFYQGRDCRIAANRCGGLVARRQAEHRQCLGQA